MELLNFLRSVPLPVLVVVVLILAIVTVVTVFQYLKSKGLDGIRANAYQLMLKAEHLYKENDQGKKKLQWVVQQARGLLPTWLQIFISEETLTKIIDEWFKGVKDLMDDGKVNGSQDGGE